MTYQKISLLIRAFLFLTLSQAFLACATQPDVPLRQETVQTEIMLRKGDMKSFGGREPHDVISVIASRNLQGAIVILRWDKEKTKFAAEVYEKEDKPGPRSSWLFRENDRSKTLNQQPNGEFYISEVMAGPDGGQRVEAFRLETD
jgi:hypothetical protein